MFSLNKFIGNSSGNIPILHENLVCVHQAQNIIKSFKQFKHSVLDFTLGMQDVWNWLEIGRKKKKEKPCYSPGVCHHVFRVWNFSAFIIWSIINIHTYTHRLKLNELIIVIFSIMDVGNKKIPSKWIDVIGVTAVPFPPHFRSWRGMKVKNAHREKRVARRQQTEAESNGRVSQQSPRLNQTWALHRWIFS